MNEGIFVVEMIKPLIFHDQNANKISTGLKPCMGPLVIGPK